MSLFQFTPLREGRRGGTQGNLYSRISIHAPPRGATGGLCGHDCRLGDFNSRPSARGDRTAAQNVVQGYLFQFTPLREGRRTWSKRANTPRYFNSRPSARGDARCNRQRRRGAYFNSRPSARGDRPFRGREVLFRRISIHAPPRGATSRRPGVRASGKFQFTPLREGRPAGRTTQYRRCYFNSRPSARGDRACRFLVFCGFPFQFTPLREGRHGISPQVEHLRNFNSRPSARGDGTAFFVCRVQCISIHAPPRGATKQQRKSATIL